MDWIWKNRKKERRGFWWGYYHGQRHVTEIKMTEAGIRTAKRGLLWGWNPIALKEIVWRKLWVGTGAEKFWICYNLGKPFHDL